MEAKGFARGRILLAVTVVAMLAFGAVGAGKAQAMLSSTPTMGYPNLGWNAYGSVIAYDPITNKVFVAEPDGSCCFHTHIFNLTTKSATAVPTNNMSQPRYETLAISGSSIFAGGDFADFHGVTTADRLAKLDTATFSNVDAGWDPNPSGTVRTLLASGSSLYVGGDFNGAGSMGGQTRNRLAKLDLTTAAVDASWNPDANNRVWSINQYGTSFIVAGEFTTIGGQSRSRVAKLNADGSVDTSWNPDPNGTVKEVDIYGSNVILRGEFTKFHTGGANEVSRNYLAMVDASTGEVTSWDPGPNLSGSYQLNAVEVVGDKIIVGGGFATIGGGVRDQLAMFGGDADNPSLDSWNPNPGPSGGMTGSSTYSLGVAGTTLITGGTFDYFGFTTDRVWSAGIGVLENVDPPQVTEPPSVTGNPVAGQTVSCSGGSFSYSQFNTNTYQWAEVDSGVPKAVWGATSSTYTLPTGTSGKKFACTKTATNIAGSASATSDMVTVSSDASPGGGGDSGGGDTADTSSCKTRGKIASKSLSRALIRGKVRVKVSTNQTGSTANLHLRADGVGAKLAARKSVAFSDGGPKSKGVTLKLRPRALRELRRRVAKRRKQGQKKLAMRLRVYCFYGGKKVRTSTSQKMSVPD